MKQNPLLATGCHPDALSLDNDHHPVPSIINIQGSAWSRAKELEDVKVHWVESNINHYHNGVSVSEDQMENFAPFFRNANSLIARGINKTHKRTGAVFAGPYRVAPCLDDESAEMCLRYALINVLKDHQVESLDENPFFSTYRQMAFGEEQKFWFIDWDEFYRKGGWKVKRHRPKDYLDWRQLKLDPLPAWESLDSCARQQKVQQIAKDAEQELKDLRKEEGRTVIGVSALFETDPRSRPKNPKTPTKKPICHTIDPLVFIYYCESIRDIEDEYIKASWDYRNGDHERAFPVGTFRPPRCVMTTIANAGAFGVADTS
jgi:hypothetical protein